MGISYILTMAKHYGYIASVSAYKYTYLVVKEQS